MHRLLPQPHVFVAAHFNSHRVETCVYIRLLPVTIGLQDLLLIFSGHHLIDCYVEALNKGLNLFSCQTHKAQHKWNQTINVMRS